MKMKSSRNANKLLKEVSQITRQLIYDGLVIEQNFPNCFIGAGQITEVNWNSYKEISFALKGVSYQEIYNHFDDAKNFNFKFTDGSLIQLSYRFKNNDLIGHRLCYLPKPKKLIYESSRQKKLIIRADYSPASTEAFNHPSTHLHIGEIEDCRIPLAGPMSPGLFILFILRTFYKDKVTPAIQKTCLSGNLFNSSILTEEVNELYIKSPHI